MCIPPFLGCAISSDSEKIREHPAQAADHAAHAETLLLLHLALALLGRAGVEEEPRRGRPRRAADHVDETAEPARQAVAHAGVEDLLGELQQAVELGAAAGQDDAAAQALIRRVLQEVFPDQGEQLLGPWLKDLTELLLRHDPR